MNKIITLDDIFKNLETEEKAFKFKDYIIDMQEEVERLHSIIKKVREYVKTIQKTENDINSYILEILDKEKEQ